MVTLLLCLQMFLFTPSPFLLNDEILSMNDISKSFIEAKYCLKMIPSKNFW